jgi:WD40 repeat protein
MTFHFIKPLIITARDNGIIEVWDLNTGEQVSQTFFCCLQKSGNNWLYLVKVEPVSAFGRVEYHTFEIQQQFDGNNFILEPLTKKATHIESLAIKES